jgi:hypothetical protein
LATWKIYKTTGLVKNFTTQNHSTLVALTCIKLFLNLLDFYKIIFESIKNLKICLRCKSWSLVILKGGY